MRVGRVGPNRLRIMLMVWTATLDAVPPTVHDNWECKLELVRGLCGRPVIADIHQMPSCRLDDFAGNHGVLIERIHRAQTMVSIRDQNLAMRRIPHQQERG